MKSTGGLSHGLLCELAANYEITRQLVLCVATVGTIARLGLELGLVVLISVCFNSTLLRGIKDFWVWGCHRWFAS